MGIFFSDAIAVASAVGFVWLFYANPKFKKGVFILAGLGIVYVIAHSLIMEIYNSDFDGWPTGLEVVGAVLVFWHFRLLRAIVEGRRSDSPRLLARAFNRLVDGQQRIQAMIGADPEADANLLELERVFRDTKEALLDHLVLQRWPNLTDDELHAEGEQTFERRLDAFLALGGK